MKAKDSLESSKIQSIHCDSLCTRVPLENFQQNFQQKTLRPEGSEMIYLKCFNLKRKKKSYQPRIRSSKLREKFVYSQINRSRWSLSLELPYKVLNNGDRKVNKQNR